MRRAAANERCPRPSSPLCRRRPRRRIRDQDSSAVFGTTTITLVASCAERVEREIRARADVHLDEAAEVAESGVVPADREARRAARAPRQAGPPRDDRTAAVGADGPARAHFVGGCRRRCAPTRRRCGRGRADTSSTRPRTTRHAGRDAPRASKIASSVSRAHAAHRRERQARRPARAAGPAARRAAARRARERPRARPSRSSAATAPALRYSPHTLRRGKRRALDERHLETGARQEQRAGRAGRTAAGDHRVSHRRRRHAEERFAPHARRPPAGLARKRERFARRVGAAHRERRIVAGQPVARRDARVEPGRGEGRRERARSPTTA